MTGATGSAGSPSGLLKFSGVATLQVGTPLLDAYLPDEGFTPTTPLAIPLDYPVPTPGRTLQNMIVNLRNLLAIFLGGDDPGTIRVSLLQSGVEVLFVTYSASDIAGPTPVKEAIGAIPYAGGPGGQRYDVRVRTTGFLTAVIPLAQLSVDVGVAP